MTPGTSPLVQLSRDELEDAITLAPSIRQLLFSFGLSDINGNYQTLYRRCSRENIDLAGIRRRAKLAMGEYAVTRKKKLAITAEQIFIDGSTVSRSAVKKRLMDASPDICCGICGLKPIWRDSPLTLILDHINGVNNDNRRENLRLVCPNCNSQLPTFGSRNHNRTRHYAPKPYARKPSRVYPPPRIGQEELAKALWEIPTVKIAKQLGVSDKAVEKWAKRYGLTKPPRGYWAKLRMRLKAA